jgi:uncharacterized repeat protein (TIGR03803 family)
LVFMLSPPAKKGDPWTETILYVFKGEAVEDASVPAGGVILDAAGNVYGTTAYGGTGGCILLGITAGCGTVYELSPPIKKGDPWTETILYSFQGGNDGYFPWGTLTFDDKRNLYGATQFGGGKGNTCNEFYGGNCGTVFELSPPKQKGKAWAEQVLRSFGEPSDGAIPNGGLVFGREGSLYGATQYGGNQGCANQGVGVGCGTIFELSPGGKNGVWTEHLIHVFTGGVDGALPRGDLAMNTKGALLGATGGGGSTQFGVVFKLTNGRRTWSESVLYTFMGQNDGRGPTSGVMLSRASGLYGAAFGGNEFGGIVYRLQIAPHGRHWLLSVVHNFTGSPDGAYPEAMVTFDRQGNLYGTTEAGGSGQSCSGGCGTVFKTSP